MYVYIFTYTFAFKVLKCVKENNISRKAESSKQVRVLSLLFANCVFVNLNLEASLNFI